MSSVLKALQRLEKQRSIEKISARPAFNTVDASSVIRRKARQSHHSERRRLLGIVALVIGVLAAMAYNTFWKARPDAAVEPVRKTAVTANAQPTTPQEKTSAVVVDARQPKAPPRKPPQASEPNLPTPKKMVARQARPAKLTPAPRPDGKSKIDPQTRPTPPPIKAPSRKRAARPSSKNNTKGPIALKPAQSNAPLPGTRKSAFRPKAAAGKKAQSRAKTAQSTLKEAPKELGLKLQAITWLNDPQKRFTVINENIVRLGERVDGYRLTNIQQDQITIEKDGQKWLLKFNRMDF